MEPSFESYLHCFAIFMLALLVPAFIFFREVLTTTEGKALNIAPLAGGALPIIGHLHLLGGRHLIHKMLAQMADRNGPAFTIRLGFQKIVVLSSWEMVRECFTAYDKAISNRPSLSASKLLAYDSAMLGLSAYGAYWRDVRKIATVELLSNHRLDLLKHIRDSELQTSIRGLHNLWSSQGCSQNGVMVDMKDWFGDLTLNILMKMVTGKRFEAEETVQMRSFRKLNRRFVELLGAFAISDAFPIISWLDIDGYKKAMRSNAKSLDELLSKLLDDHKQKRMSGGEGKEEQDFMDVMLNSVQDVKGCRFDADTIIKATCLNLVSGSDSIMVALTWTLALLLNHRHVLKKAQEELDVQVGRDRAVQESDLKNLVYLQAIVKEAMRLYPPSAIIGLREVTEDCTLANGYSIPSGTRLIVNVWKLHRDESVWSDPHSFDPGRFMGTDTAGVIVGLMPFGLGRRSCPGMTLALQVLHFTIAALLHGFEITVPFDEPVDMTESNGLTCLKATPLEALVIPRLRPAIYD